MPITRYSLIGNAAQLVGRYRFEGSAARPDAEDHNGEGSGQQDRRAYSEDADKAEPREEIANDDRA